MSSFEGPPKKPTVAELYDDLYTKHPEAMRGGQVDEAVVAASAHLPEGARILDTGAGQGRNALYLAGRGYKVHAVDLSPKGVEAINERARQLGLSSITAEVADIRSGIEGMYDGIVSAIVLHHLRTDEAEALVRDMQAHTAAGGVNVLILFTKDSDFVQYQPGMYFPAPDEVRRAYLGWEELSYREARAKTYMTHPDGSPQINTVAEFLFRKL